MLVRTSVAAVIVLAACSVAMAACPPAATTGTSAEMIASNSQRLLCLQQEIAAEASRRKYEFDVLALQRSLDQLQLQQRLDTITPPPPPLLFP